jgi:hypothetical protein
VDPAAVEPVDEMRVAAGVSCCRVTFVGDARDSAVAPVG